jgi:hypothetical protein
MGQWYERARAGYCTRCGEPFAADAELFMVRETIAWSFYTTFVLTQPERVAVCSGCVSAAEMAAATITSVCAGCGHRLIYPAERRLRMPQTCSPACAQRVRRQLHRPKRLTCQICRKSFTSARRDARFCSNACRQWHYRRART